MTLTNRLRTLAATSMFTLLAACGGGGGGDDAADTAAVLEAPPATAVSLQTTPTEASGAAAAGMDSAQRLVQLSASLNGSIPALADGGSAALSLGRVALSSARERALARETISCSDFFGSSSCSGSLTIDTNASGSGTVVPAGTYVEMTFNNLQGSHFDDSPVQINGKLRLEYLTAFDTNASSLAGLRVQMTFINFSGSADDVPFGPLDEVALYEFDSQGVAQMTIDGLRIIGLNTMSVIDADNYSLTNVSVRRAHWATPSGYVDMSFQNWFVEEGRPDLNSRVTIAAPNSSIAVVVTASSVSTVVYAVTATVNGAAVSYTVTASYPAGGGAPSYAVVATPT